MDKDKFPEGTIISGELAFVPISDNEGGGFKTVDIKTGKEYKSFKDRLVFENEKESEPILMEIPKKTSKIDFDVNYETLLMTSEVCKTIMVDEEKETERVINKPAIKKKNDDNIHKGHRERMKKRFAEHGLSNFSAHEVIEMLLYFAQDRRDTNPIAHRLINEFGSIQNVLKADMHDLMSVPGVGEQSALLINFIRQFIIYVNQNIEEAVTLPNVTTAGLFCCNYFMQHTEEHFIVLVLDTTRRIKKIVEISKGTENETAYYPRKVIEAAIKHKANAVMIAHITQATACTLRKRI
jgi:DNA repair protein RadC